MANTSPMGLLRDLAEQTLTETTAELGKAQRACDRATQQLNQLENYQSEYQQQLHASMQQQGVLMADLLNHQSFIDSLTSAVKQHAAFVADCRQKVDQTRQTWRQDKQRLNAFETLQSRAKAAEQLKEHRLEQRMMDEFAQRASMRREV
ncbi:flagellar export protein FliJ [Pantoea sp.]|uniref:flagellar export protein FliJ n=1 Tax=Pantoea sp. TaxID=69393 RepID=UPI00289992F2|nr:flagellar export protein FliJ [Pantoea sp.]